MIYTIIFHKRIGKDYAGAYKWYENQKEGLGEKFLLAVRTKIGEIAVNPQIYGEKGRKGYREARVDVFPFLIVYRFDTQKQEIFVSSIHHAKKHPKNKYPK
jgi:mRNA-degrading endonuclease RelE of RelBE toxin-antitoxin system